MAMNPMQRRARNSFLIGFLVALVIMAVVVFILLFQIKSAKEAIQKFESSKRDVWVATKDIKSGEEVSMDGEDFKSDRIPTEVDTSKVIDSSFFESTDSEGNVTAKKIVAKVPIAAGTIVTKDMLVDDEKLTTDSTRVQEYNMIILPSQLTNEDYIDIRLSLPSGQDYIVLSKKMVLGTNETSIWLQLNEEEILMLNNAIVESYTIIGSKLYAIQYVDPGIQKGVTPTYVPSADVVDLIGKDPNILEVSRNELWARIQESSEYRTKYLEGALSANLENQPSLVSAGNANEMQSVKTLRQEFVESLEGSEDIGYTR